MENEEVASEEVDEVVEGGEEEEEEMHLAGRWKSWPASRLAGLNGFMPSGEYTQLELFHRFFPGRASSLLQS